MPRTPKPSRHADRHDDGRVSTSLRRRTVAALVAGSMAAGAFSFAAIDAIAQELGENAEAAQAAPVELDPAMANLRLARFARAAEATEQERLEFLADEFQELVAFVSPEGISLERRELWGRLADCESGDWYDGVPAHDTRRWDYGLSFDHGDIFEGGLNFHPRTWDAFRDPDMPGHAGEATAVQQMVVGERVLAAQGWKAWPVCSRKLGLR